MRFGDRPVPATERTAALRALNKYISRFKVYVPPGSTYLQIMLYLPKLGQVATVSRFGQPPTGDYSEYTYADFPIDSDAGATMAQLQAGDYITRNSGGHTTLINQYSPKVPTGGGWLYVRVFAFDASVPIENRYTLRVGLPQYQAWFQAMDQTLGWDTFGETGGYVVAGVSDDSGYASDTGLGGGGTYTPPPTSYSYTSNTAPSSGGTSGSTSNLNNLKIHPSPAPPRPLMPGTASDRPRNRCLHAGPAAGVLAAVKRPNGSGRSGGLLCGGADRGTGACILPAATR